MARCVCQVSSDVRKFATEGVWWSVVQVLSGESCKDGVLHLQGSMLVEEELVFSEESENGGATAAAHASYLYVHHEFHVFHC